MKYQIKQISSKSQWDFFVLTSPQANIYCLSSFLDSLDIAYELIGVWEGKKLLLGAIILMRDRVPITAPHPFTLYQGLLFSADFKLMPLHSRTNLQMELTTHLIESLAKKYSVISLCLHHSIIDIRSFDWFHYHEPKLGRFNISVRYTGLLDLTKLHDFDNEYPKSIRELRRRDVKKAVNFGFHISESKDIAILTTLYEMTLNRQNEEVAVSQKQIISNIARNALKHNFGHILVCKDEIQRVASATLFLFDKTTGYYCIGANDPQFRHLGAGSYIILESIRYLFNHGIKLIDFMGMNSPNRGDYKSSFNANPVPYYQVTWTNPNKS